MRRMIIEVPEEVLWDIENGHVEDRNVYEYANLIHNGTPLPKGHGRIADMDAAIKCIEDCEGEDAIWAISLIEWACSKRTIIEADKEVEI